MQHHSGQLAAAERQHKQTGCGTDENLCEATTAYDKYLLSTLHHRKQNTTGHQVYGRGVTTPEGGGDVRGRELTLQR